LNLKKLQSPAGHWRIRVGDWRAAFRPAEGDFYIALIGLRDGFYQSLDRITPARSGGGVQLVEVSRVTEATEPSPQAEVKRPRGYVEDNALIAFKDKELTAIDGLGDGTLRKLRRIPGGIDLLEGLQDVCEDPELVQLLVDMTERQAHYGAIFDAGLVPTRSDAQIDEEEFAKRLRSVDSSSAVIEIESREELEQILNGSLKDWMMYITPEQKQFARAEFNGPSLLKGGPGTGKTVVALHRAAYWTRGRTGAERKVLLTTFVENLPKVWCTLLRSMSSPASIGVDCRNVDKIAHKIVRSASEWPTMIKEPHRLTIASDLVRKHNIGGRFAGSADLLLDEFDHFIAGTGVGTKEAYLTVERRGAGAGSQISAETRSRVFNAYRDYVEELRKSNQFDYPHLRLEALALARKGQVPADCKFLGIIVDEAQDVSAVAIQLLLELDESPAHSRFMLIADGQQAIYPGGFVLKDVGVAVTGRSRTLTRNWRNTWWISATAGEIVSGAQFTDVEGLDPEKNPVLGQQLREGEPVNLHVLSPGEDDLVRIIQILKDLESDGIPLGECAVLGWTNAAVGQVITGLKEAGIGSLNMKEWIGEATTEVLVGTIHRARGLEFRAVIVIGLGHSDRADWASAVARRDDETAWLELRMALVAMTRARDTLHLVSVGDPWPPIASAAEFMNSVPLGS